MKRAIIVFVVGVGALGVLAGVVYLGVNWMFTVRATEPSYAISPRSDEQVAALMKYLGLGSGERVERVEARGQLDGSVCFIWIRLTVRGGALDLLEGAKGWRKREGRGDFDGIYFSPKWWTPGDGVGGAWFERTGGSEGKDVAMVPGGVEETVYVEVSSNTAGVPSSLLEWLKGSAISDGSSFPSQGNLYEVRWRREGGG